MPANSAASPSEAQPSTPKAGEPPTFEAAMERLEAIVEQMENARLPLEELIRSYEEGTRLIRVCSERLSAAEQRIEIITRDAAGQPRVSEYPPAAATAPAASALPPPKPVREPKSGSESPQPVAAVSRSSKTPNEVSLF
jgi:exodeoxyribonuclease VII small subunit